MLNFKQREVLAEKLMDLGNIAVASLVFGIVVRAEWFSIPSLMIGLMIGIAAYIYAIKLVKGIS